MRTYEDIAQMANGDYAIGLEAHYKPLANLIKEREYKDIIEVGTAYGGNANYMLEYANIASLTCVDPYIFYPAMPGFTCQQEYDTLFEFATNRLKPWPQAEIWRMTSMAAIGKLGLFCGDLVFLDGSHDYEDVIWECEHYAELVSPGGVLSGHDYNIFEGVNKAVDEYGKKINKPVQVLHGNIWFFDL